MKTVTKKDLLIERYTALEKHLRLHLNTDLFPSLDSIDVIDLSFFITMTFVGVESETEIKSKIREIIETYSINIDEYKFSRDIAPPIVEFLTWYRTL